MGAVSYGFPGVRGTFSPTQVYEFTVTGQQSAHANQGVAVAPSNFFTTLTALLVKYGRSGDDLGAQVGAGHDPTTDEPLGKEQINGICYNSANDTLYVGANNFPTTPKLGWIVEYSPTDLSYIAHHSVEAHFCEGCALRNGEFWAFYHDWPYVSRYDASWNLVANYLLPGVESETDLLFQGGFWINDDLYLVQHRDRDPDVYYFIYRWNGTQMFLLDKQLSPTDNGVQCGQGIANEGTTAWWAQRDGGGLNQHRVVKTSMALKNI